MSSVNTHLENICLFPVFDDNNENVMKKLLVIRNDKIGDFMLAWPAFACLKAALPDVEITALVPNYTQALATLCPSIDKVIVDTGKNATKADKKALIQKIKLEGFDASICFFSDSYNAYLVWRAGIKTRFAPATKWSQIFYNHRITQRRSRSEKPEFEYNIELANAFLQHLNLTPPPPQLSPPYLLFDNEQITAQKEKLSQTLGVAPGRPWIFVHSGSGGSANNLSLAQYCDLIEEITDEFNVEWVLTAGPGEEEKTRELHQLLAAKNIAALVYDKNEGLVDFTCSIACASAFIAGSTGPLHVAASLDVPTIGFFPAKRSATPLRWRPINSEDRHLAFSPEKDEDKGVASDMSRIEIASIAPRVNAFLKNFSR